MSAPLFVEPSHYEDGGFYIQTHAGPPLGHRKYMVGFSNEERFAHLFAAAPELLEALKWCKAQGFARYSRRLQGQNEEFCDAVDRLDAAIAKAEGRA